MKASKHVKVPYLPPRVPNRALDIQATIDSWDNPREFPGEWLVASLGESPYGNLNVGGTIDGATAPTVPEWHPQFETMIEKGIRSICLYFVRIRGWITYTSCEGHWYEGQKSPPSLRHVGLLPRNSEEYTTIKAFLEQTVRRYQTISESQACLLGLICQKLEDPKESRHVIDMIFFPKEDVAWSNYFGELESESSVVLSIMQKS